MKDEEIKLLAKLLSTDPDYLKIMEHLKIANVDYIKNINKYTKIDIDKIQKIILELLDLKIVEEVHLKTVKRTTARLKKQFQVRMHHTYYRLTNLGKLVYRYLRDSK
ncbi:hypothetical protein MJ1_0362 [Nanobdella aerobiophila]|uniref:DUF2250 domain-containing protein n=1 Tax=Nanobdella aerobiophila TaxID=2586965 RepID=A0A915SKS1_9ARCH|nr:DUF2250 domain-containing protein [Nanobdella aerobiophila]BBL45526.1 hypothetical protein MJ1_0362 [Nanobdella aerobiophila]